MNQPCALQYCLAVVCLSCVLAGCGAAPTESVAKTAAAAKPAAQPGTTDIAELRLADWQPRSMMDARVTSIDKAAFPVVDVHNHLGQIDDVAAIVAAMDAAGVQTTVNLDGGWGDRLEAQLAKFDQAYPGRFATFALIDFKGIDDPRWTERTVAQLRTSFQSGAAGLKIHKSLGLFHRYKSGQFMAVDDSKLDPIWALCGEMKRPVMIHIADPAAFFTPLDRFNERWHELNQHPDWLFYGDQYPSRDELLAQRNRVLARHPNTMFIGAHFGNNPENLRQVGEWLDRYPNFYVDIDARISELGRQPYSARRFFLKYADRILFGTDTAPVKEMYDVYFRFLETDDEYFDPEPSHHRQGFWMIYGLFLPKSVLEKVYRGNAARLGLGAAKAR